MSSGSGRDVAHNMFTIMFIRVLKTNSSSIKLFLKEQQLFFGERSTSGRKQTLAEFQFLNKRCSIIYKKISVTLIIEDRELTREFTLQKHMGLHE
jgi:hypothetical protein